MCRCNRWHLITNCSRNAPTVVLLVSHTATKTLHLSCHTDWDTHAHKMDVQTQEENKRTKWGDVYWAVARRQGDWNPAPSMPSSVQLPLVLREPHDEDDVLRPHPRVSIRMWAERLLVCVGVGARECVCETRQESTQWATLLENNDLNRVQVLRTAQVARWFS